MTSSQLSLHGSNFLSSPLFSSFSLLTPTCLFNFKIWMMVMVHVHIVFIGKSLALLIGI